MTEMKTTLSIEESARLIELGVDAKLASGESLVGGALFTLTDILSILPKSYFSEEYYDTMNLSIETLNGKWFVNYRYYCGGELAAQDVEMESPELIDVLNSLLIWCLKEKKININTDKKCEKDLLKTKSPD